MKIGALIPFALFAASPYGFAAQVDQNDLSFLSAVASEQGAVRVAINIDPLRKLNASAEEKSEHAKRVLMKTEKLKAELGDQAYSGGFWSNATGQIGLYVKRGGLQILQNSQNAISFTRDISDKMRIKISDLDGGLSALHNAINREGTVVADIVLSTDGTSYRLLPDGSVSIDPSAELSEQVPGVVNKLKELVADRAEFANSVRVDPIYPMIISAKVDKAALLFLQESDLVRNLRPKGFKDARKTTWSDFDKSNTRPDGRLEFLVTLRGGILFSPNMLYKATAARYQAQANRAAAKEIFEAVGISLSKEDPVSDFQGIFEVALLPDQYERLKLNADPRILDAQANRPMATTKLGASAPQINAPAAWTAGVRGAGQTIVIIDHGVRSDHKMLMNGSAKRVVAQDCFGSDSGGYTSICPGKNITLNGDSPATTPNSGEPLSNAIKCQQINLNIKCGHGTHMAVIAAGRSTPLVDNGNLQGVAPDASLHSINVFSYNMNANTEQAFLTDITKALQWVAQLSGGSVGPSAPVAQMVVNMSIGSVATYQNDCDAAVSVPSRIALQTLRWANIPVFSSTGNHNIQNGVNWPACSEFVIKVAAVPNDGAGVMKASYSNLGIPSNYSSPTIFAPGGEPSPGVRILSAGRVDDVDIFYYYGTSQAAAHVSGFAALYKSTMPTATVADFVSWVNSVASIPVPFTLPSGPVSAPRILYP